MTDISHRGRTKYFAAVCRCFLSLSVLACAIPRANSAEQRSPEDAAAVHIVAHDTSALEVLTSIAANYHVRFRSSVPLDERINGVYSGSLEEVMPRLLRAYDLFIKRDRDRVEIVVIRKRLPPGAASLSGATKTSGTAAAQNLASRTISSRRR